MFSSHQHRPRDSNPLGKHRRVQRLGLNHADEHQYNGYRVRIVQRRMGVTVKQIQYSASVLDAFGNPAAYLTSLTSLAAARSAAEAWIDRAIALQEEARQRTLEQILAGAIKQSGKLGKVPGGPAQE